MKYWDIIWVTKLRYPPATAVWPSAIFDTFHSNWIVSNERMFSANGSSNESNLPFLPKPSDKSMSLKKRNKHEQTHLDAVCTTTTFKK